MKPHRGTLILVFGILSLVICMPLGIASWIMGSADLKAMAAGEMDPEGKQLTNIGRILGMISVALAIVGVVIAILVMAMGGMAAVLGSGGVELN